MKLREMNTHQLKMYKLMDEWTRKICWKSIP